MTLALRRAADVEGPVASQLVPTVSEATERITQAIHRHGTPLADRVLGPMLRASPLFFAMTILDGPPQPPFCGRLLFSDYHLEWEDIVRTKKRFLIKASRSGGKTFFHSFIVPLWRIVTDPTGSGFIFGGTELNAQRILEDIRREIEKNPKLQWLYPSSRSRKWTATQIRASNGHHITARGYRTRVRGSHPTWAVADDVLTDEDAYSDAQRKKNIEFWFTAISSMVVQGGSLGICGTPMHRQDLISEIEGNPAYHSGCYPAVGSDGQSTWPEVFSTPYLDELRIELGSVRFARERLCSPVSDDMSLFPKSLFFADGVMQPTVCLGQPRSYWEQAGVRRIFIGVDFAFSTSVGADFFCVWVMGLDDHDNRWIIDIYREKGVPYGTQKQMIVTYGRRYAPETIYLEANQAQQIVADELIQQTDLPIRKFYTTAEKHSLSKGIPGMRVLLENRKYRIPRGDQHSVEATDIFIDECNNFTWINGKVQSVGGHDDVLMSAYVCEQAVKSGGFTFRIGDEDEPVKPMALPATAVEVPSASQTAIIQDALSGMVPTSTPAPARIVMRNGVPVRVDG